MKLGLDLISFNIQRARDHGIPGYTTIRHNCYPNETKIESFDDLISKGDISSEVKLFSKKYKFNLDSFKR